MSDDQTKTCVFPSRQNFMYPEGIPKTPEMAKKLVKNDLALRQQFRPPGDVTPFQPQGGPAVSATQDQCDDSDINSLAQYAGKIPANYLIDDPETNEPSAEESDKAGDNDDLGPKMEVEKKVGITRVLDGDDDEKETGSELNRFPHTTTVKTDGSEESTHESAYNRTWGNDTLGGSVSLGNYGSGHESETTASPGGEGETRVKSLLNGSLLDAEFHAQDPEGDSVSLTGSVGAFDLKTELGQVKTPEKVAETGELSAGLYLEEIEGKIKFILTPKSIMNHLIGIEENSLNRWARDGLADGDFERFDNGKPVGSGPQAAASLPKDFAPFNIPKVTQDGPWGILNLGVIAEPEASQETGLGGDFKWSAGIDKGNPELSLKTSGALGEGAGVGSELETTGLPEFSQQAMGGFEALNDDLHAVGDDIEDTATHWYDEGRSFVESLAGSSENTGQE